MDQSRRFTRRQMMQLGAAVTAAGLLQACGGGSQAPAAAPTAAATAAPATLIAQPFQQTTPTAAPTTQAAAQPAAVPPRPTPVTQTMEIEFTTERGEDDHYVLSANENTKHFNEKYPSVSVKITTGQKTEAAKLRLQEHKPAEIGNTGASATNIADSIAAIKANFVYNLQDAMKQESWDVAGKSWNDTISPLIQPLLQVPGYPGVWSLPNNVTTLNFYYNKKLFDKVGAQPPATWSELDAVCKKLKDAGIAPFTIDGTSADGYMDWWFDSVSSRLQGNDVYRDVLRGKTTMAEHPAFLKAAQMIRDFIDKEYFVKGYSGLDFTGSQMVFYQGQAAMLYVGSWLLGEMRKAIPDDFLEDVFRFPMVTGGTGDPKHLFGTANTYGISKESTHPELGVEWCRCYNSIAMTNWRSTNVSHQPAILGADPPTKTPSLNKIFADSTKMDIYNNADLYSQMGEHFTTSNDLNSKLFRKEVTPEDFIKQMDANIKAFHAKG
jgi:raffinose/stachyose/melibiose transport system substrate-binding protein